MKARAKVAWVAAIGVPVLFVALALLQTRIDASVWAQSAEDNELMLRSGSVLKRMSLGYDSLLADIYWTRTVQYYGRNTEIRGSKFPQLWPLLDITTTLDPKLIPAYRFGGVFLSEPPPSGAADPNRAVELTQRGIAANPDDWQMGATLGFLYYWYLKDYPKSSAAYLQASKNPNAVGWLGMMAARVALMSDSADTSKMIWSEIYQSTPNPLIRKQAQQHLEALHAMQDIQLLNDLSEKYRATYGHYPLSMEDLTKSGFIRGVPTDPSGELYVIGVDGKANVGPRSTIVPEVPPPTPPTRH
jgi:hypothetical protein